MNTFSSRQGLGWGFLASDILCSVLPGIFSPPRLFGRRRCRGFLHYLLVAGIVPDPLKSRVVPDVGHRVACLRRLVQPIQRGSMVAALLVDLGAAEHDFRVRGGE